MRTVTPKNAKTVPPQAKRVFEGVIYDVYQWQLPMYDGTTGTFEMLKRPDTLKVLAIKDDKVVVIHETQPDGPPFYDLPGGRHDYDAETEVEAAKREMLEETGMVFKNWKLISASQRHTKIEHFLYLFVASDFASQTKQHLDRGEKIEVQELTLAEVKKLIGNSRTRYLPKEIFEPARTVQDILDLPEYEA